MQIKKAGAVAIGALATVAAMGAPAAAATQAQTASADRAQAMRAVGSQFLGGAARGDDGWDAPWDQEQQALLSVATGSAVSLLALQGCGSVGGLGAAAVAAAISSPSTVVGDCTNANIKLSQDTVPGVISVLSDTAISIGSIQACGSVVGGGAAAVGAALQSPNTVLGSCDNGNIVISGKDEYKDDDHKDEDDWDHGYKSAKADTTARAWGSGYKAAKADTTATRDWDHGYKAKADGDWDHGYKAKADGDWDHGYKAKSDRAWDTGYGHHEESANVEEVANATTLRKVGATTAAPVRSTWVSRHAAPATQRNGDDGWDAPWDVDPMTLVSVGTGSAIQALTLQACGSTAGLGAVAIAASISSPNTVLSDCNNANVWIDQEDPTALISVLDNTSINVAPIQICGSTAGGGAAAIAVSLQSPNTVFGNCNNANVTID